MECLTIKENEILKNVFLILKDIILEDYNKSGQFLYQILKATLSLIQEPEFEKAAYYAIEFWIQVSFIENWLNDKSLGFVQRS